MVGRKKKTTCKIMSIYEWGNLFVLFCLYLWDPQNQDASDCLLGLFGNLLWRRGAFSWRLDLQCRNSWVLNDFFTENKLNHSWNLRRNWNVPLVMLERSWWAGFNGIYLVRFGFRMWEILDFMWIQPLKIQTNSKKPVFEGKVSWGRVDTWANGIGHTSVS
jgi:hypothetical protein